MSVVNIVTNFQLITQIKTSRYFRVSLGLIPTIEKNGSRKYNDNDRFSFFYNNSYNTTIYGQGNVGNIKFYTDHYITDNVLAVYYDENFEEYEKIKLDYEKNRNTKITYTPGGEEQLRF